MSSPLLKGIVWKSSLLVIVISFVVAVNVSAQWTVSSNSTEETKTKRVQAQSSSIFFGRSADPKQDKLLRRIQQDALKRLIMLADELSLTIAIRVSEYRPSKESALAGDS